MSGKKRLNYGIGINDSEFSDHSCPYQKRWTHMLERCYNGKNKSYLECTVCKEWLTFSNFEKWMKKQDWEGKELDKDILVYGNKIYSPDTCCFVSKEINVLISNGGRPKGKYPRGVYFNKVSKKFLAQITKFGIKKHIGSYELPEQAEKAYTIEKAKYIKLIADLQTEEKLKKALIKISEIIGDNKCVLLQLAE
jgi:hypothetical protein